MEIDITTFVREADPFEYSASYAERGENAATETWRNALALAARAPLLHTGEALDALRAYMKGFGAWEDKEIEAWSADECNALFIQLVSADMREAGMDDVDEFDWEEYEHRVAFGESSGRIYRGDDGHIYFYLGD